MNTSEPPAAPKGGRRSHLAQASILVGIIASVVGIIGTTIEILEHLIGR